MLDPSRRDRSAGNKFRTHAAKHPTKAQASAHHFTLSDTILLIYVFFEGALMAIVLLVHFFLNNLFTAYLMASLTAETRRCRMVLANNEL